MKGKIENTPQDAFDNFNDTMKFLRAAQIRQLRNCNYDIEPDEETKPYMTDHTELNAMLWDYRNGKA